MFAVKRSIKKMIAICVAAVMALAFVPQAGGAGAAHAATVSADEEYYLSIVGQPTRSVYLVGDSFDPAGINVALYKRVAGTPTRVSNLTYNTGTTYKYAIDTPVFGTAGEYDVRISYSYDSSGQTPDLGVVVFDDVLAHVNVLDIAEPSKDGDTYLIASPDDLAWLSISASGAVRRVLNARLTADVDMSGADFFAPIGMANNDYQYRGDFDGNGKTVTLDFSDDTKDVSGLFGYIGAAVSGTVAGNVHDLTVAGTVKGKQYVGGIAAYNNGTIERVTNAAIIVATGNYSGGITGYMGSSTNVRNATNDGSVTGVNYTGGIVGNMAGGNVRNAVNNGAVVAALYTGGIAGYVAAAGRVSNSVNNGAVEGTAEVGGAVGTLLSPISRVVNNGNVKATAVTPANYTNCAGGIVGRVNAANVTISNCSNTGNVTGKAMASGGIAGSLGMNVNNVIEDCYNMGDITCAAAEESTVTNWADAGGIAGYIHTQANCVIGNVVNLGKVSSEVDNANIGGIVGTVGPVNTSNISNAYYLDSALIQENGRPSAYGTPNNLAELAENAAAMFPRSLLQSTLDEMTAPEEPKDEEPKYEESPVPSDLAGAAVDVPQSAVWTGSQVRPARLAVKLGGKTLKEGVDYTVSYGANVNIGKGTVTVTAKSASYKGSKGASFNILPKPVLFKKLTVGKKLLKVALAKAAAAQKLSGCQIQYRVKGKAKWSGTKNISAKKLSYSIKSLKKGKRYEVRIRAYKIVDGTASESTYYYGAWAAKTSGRVK
ncbi:MAG: fibronectin type III domain-containing protein [Clostridiales Family XIII bacterium]|jgi:hypothetical protein|nr:fibronectin type III domain-containing protein [Clostridiales Family XIII bacterium]